MLSSRRGHLCRVARPSPSRFLPSCATYEERCDFSLAFRKSVSLALSSTFLVPGRNTPFLRIGVSLHLPGAFTRRPPVDLSSSGPCTLLFTSSHPALPFSSLGNRCTSLRYFLDDGSSLAPSACFTDLQVSLSSLPYVPVLICRCGPPRHESAGWSPPFSATCSLARDTAYSHAFRFLFCPVDTSVMKVD